MPSYTTTGTAYYEVHDNQDTPWNLRIDAEYDVWVEPWQALQDGKTPPQTNAKLTHIYLYRRFEDSGPWEPVPWDFINHSHWDHITDLAHNYCREEATNFALLGWDYDRDRELELSRL